MTHPAAARWELVARASSSPLGFAGYVGAVLQVGAAVRGNAWFQLRAR